MPLGKNAGPIFCFLNIASKGISGNPVNHIHRPGFTCWCDRQERRNGMTLINRPTGGFLQGNPWVHSISHSLPIAPIASLLLAYEGILSLTKEAEQSYDLSVRG